MTDKLEYLKGLGKEMAGGLTGHDDLENEGREQEERAKETPSTHAVEQRSGAEPYAVDESPPASA